MFGPSAFQTSCSHLSTIIIYHTYIAPFLEVTAGKERGRLHIPKGLVYSGLAQITWQLEHFVWLSCPDYPPKGGSV